HKLLRGSVSAAAEKSHRFSVQSTPDHRSCVHIQPDADPKMMVSLASVRTTLLGGGSECDRVAEGFELSNVAALLGSRIDVSGVVVGAQIPISGVWIVQQVPDDDQDGATDRDDCSGLSTTSGNAAVTGRQESVRFA